MITASTRGSRLPMAPKLVGNLRTAKHRHEGRPGMLDGLREEGEFRLEQPTGDPWASGHGLRNTDHRCMITVGGTEGVVDVDVAEAGKGSGELGVILLLTGMESEVFQEHDRTRHRRVDRGPRCRTDAVIGSKGDIDTRQEVRQPLGDGLKTVLRFEARSRGATQVAHQDQAAATIKDRLQRGQGHADPAVVKHASIPGQGNVEVHPDQDAFAGNVNCIDGYLGHAHAPCSRRVRYPSSNRRDAP